MNHREPKSTLLRVGQALPCLALLLLPSAADRAWSRPIVPYAEPMPEPTPYLAAIGSPALRFQEALPPPDLVTRPPASAPPHPSDTPGVAKPDVIPFTATLPAKPAEPAAAPMPAVAAAQSAPEHLPAPILPDELRPRVRPEDFLPYFEIPAAKPGDPNVIVPVPRGAPAAAPLPPSSATYTQSPQ